VIAMTLQQPTDCGGAARSLERLTVGAVVSIKPSSKAALGGSERGVILQVQGDYATVEWPNGSTQMCSLHALWCDHG
jgi:hypothetical protein